ncbi:MAG: sulfotransferase, partial [Okeania sp. SIO2H7]|nr:sulfotransferase [Okeania sp. SIO2H7]
MPEQSRMDKQHQGKSVVSDQVFADEGWTPRLLHPLMGADPKTLFQVLRRNGGTDVRCLPHITLAIATCLARQPISAVEAWRMAQLRQRAPEMSPPIFIVGHWRSGTTFLYELLCQSPQFNYVSPFAAGIPWDFLTVTQFFQPLLEKLLPKDRFIDQVQVTASSPQEDEIALASMQPLSFYHGLYFPSHLQENLATGLFLEGCSDTEVQRWERAIALLLEKLHVQNPQGQVLIKNPVYTGRVNQLRSLFPAAKFIHIYRNPYVVFQSTRNFYVKLFRELALQSVSRLSMDTLDALIFQCYTQMMTALQQDVADLPPEQFVELQFETFEQDPVANVETIYQQLKLPGFESAKAGFKRYLGDRRTYRKNKYTFPQA